MKPNEFKSLIRQIVIEEIQRELSKEVQRQLPRILFEMLDQKSQKQPIVHETITKEFTSQPQIKSPVVKENPIQKKTTKRYAKNPILNQILNETTPGLPQMSNDDGGVPIPQFNKIGGVSDEFIGEVKQILNEEVIQPNLIEQDEVSEEPHTDGPNLSKMFNKDFRSIVNKSKSKNGIGSNLSNSILQSW